MSLPAPCAVITPVFSLLFSFGGRVRMADMDSSAVKGMIILRLSI